MLREECKTGMKVVFGRPNGEKTVGEIVEVHETRAAVRTLEARGDGNRGSEEHRTKKRPAGTVWKTDLDIIEPLDERLLEALQSLPQKDENLLDYLERGSETLCAYGKMQHFGMHGWECIGGKEQDAILQAISSNYEHRRSIHKVSSSMWRQSCLDDLNKRLVLLFEALGRPVSEAVSRAWKDNQRVRLANSKDFVSTKDLLHDNHQRKESQARIEAGLNEARQTPPTPLPVKWPAPRPSKFPTLEQRRKVWQAQKEAARQAPQAAQTP